MRLLILFSILIFGAIISCDHGTGNNPVSSRPGNADMEDLNRYLVTKDVERIRNYIERKNLRMTETGTGLWYQILKEGEGKYLRDNDRIIMDYECSLLDGTKCYSSYETGPKEIILGRSEIEAGLNEGLRLLKPGSEALFILPPFLAYGLIGDRKAIPPRATIVYNVSVRTE